MAKARSGLGRGLGSLLSGESESILPQEAPTPVDRYVVKQDEKRTSSSGSDKKIDLPAVPKAPASANETKKTEEVYSSKADNITIKSVVEREAKKPVEEKKLVNKQDEQEKESLEIDVDLIEPNPNQPRTNFKKEELEELAASIKKNGLLSPILVRQNGDKYQIIAGERRWQACKEAGLKKIPVRIKDASDDEAIMLALVENIQRSDLNPIEEAYGYRRMMERGNMTQSEVAQAVSKGRSTIANALRLLELPEEAQQLLFEEKITAGHARAILSVPTKEGRLKLTNKLAEEGLSVRETEAIARLLAGKKEETSSQPKPQLPRSYKTVARALKETLDTNVKVKSTKGKNKIEIEFKDEADLQRLFRIISS